MSRCSFPLSRATIAGVAAMLAVGCIPPAHAQITAPVVNQPGELGGERASHAAAAVGVSTPRFVSLKADRVNVRRGPGHDHGIDWVFRRAGLPVEIIASSDIWRRVRDSEGASGWVLASLVSGRRTALVLPWEVKPGAPPPQVALKAHPRENAVVIAQVEAGVIANIRWCDGNWCQVGIASLMGFIEQPRLWGVYKGEVVR